MLKMTRLSALAALLISVSSWAQITVTNDMTPEEYVTDVLVGSGVTVSNITFNGSVPAAGTIQAQVGYFNAGASGFDIPEGVIMATGNCTVAVGPNSSGSSSGGTFPDPFDPDLDAICSASLNDAAILEFDFIPSGDSISFNYIFGSEEYLEFVDAGFNDAFGFFLSGPGIAGPYSGGAINLAVVPGTGSPGTPVTIDNVNDVDNAAYFINNAGGTAVQYDGHTVTMTAAAAVECGETYHIKLAICDAGDGAWDSGVFIEASSFSSNGIQVEIASATGSAAITEGCDSALVTFIRPADADTSVLDVDYGISGTAINGTDYGLLSGSVTFPIGEDTVEFWIVPVSDGLTEGTETVIITVDIVNECGDTITTEATMEIVDPMPFGIVVDDILIDCPTDFVDLTAAPDGGVPDFTYSWSTGDDTPTISVPGDVPGTTTYTIDIEDACGVTSTESVDVILTPATVPTITFNENTFTICPSGSADIESTVNDPYSTPIDYSWTPGGMTTPDVSVSPSTLTWYYLTINDGCYTVTDSVKVEIGGVDITDITVVDATDCPGTGSSTPGSILIEPDDPTWTYEIIGYVPPQTSGFFPGLDGGINYIVNVTDADGCTSDTLVFVGLGANAVTADFILDSLRDVTCFGDNDGGAYVNNLNGGLAPPFDVTWTHSSGVHDVDTGLPVGGASEQDNLYGGTWVVTVTDGLGCAWSYPFEIEEPEELAIELTISEPTCYGFSDGSVTANVTGGNGGNTYVITDSEGTKINPGNTPSANTLPTGDYTVTVTDSEGCSISTSIFLSEPGQLDVDLNITQPECYGINNGLVIVDTVYNYTGDYDSIGYYWIGNPGGVSGINAVINKNFPPGDHTITINDENGCSRIFDFTIEWPEELLFSQLGTQPAYCRQYYYQSGNGVVFAAATGGTPDFTYEWLNLGTGASSTNTTWGGLNPGNYQISVWDDSGCLLRDTVVLDSINPIAEFDPTSPQFTTIGLLEGTAPVTVTFTNQSTGFANPNNPSADTTFFWNFDTPNAPWVISEDYFEVFDTTYLTGGTYNVCLVAINKNGCTDTTCKEIIVYDPLAFTPVNIFTPDGNGKNDLFTFYDKSQAVAEFHCVIVNRWGKTVFEMNHITDAWDGRDMNGDVCTDGVYFYTYEGEADNGDQFSGQGTVTIAHSK